MNGSERKRVVEEVEKGPQREHEHRVLVLTNGYAPHKVVSWDRAITMIYTHKVEVVEHTDEVIYQKGDVVIHMPSVVRLSKPTPRLKKAIKFSRMNVFTRDGFSCCYCGSPKRMHELNYDHVTPREQGGKTVWENIVSACYPCNSRKANRTPEQAGMKLLRRPHKPKHLPMMGPRFDPKDIPAAWVEWVKDYFVQHEAVA